MGRFLAVRYVAFALFILFCGLIGSFAALNLGFMTSGVITLQALVEALDIYLVAVSVINVVFIVPVVGTELYRRGALTSRIWFELLWVSAFFLAYLGGAITSTMLIPNAVCNTGGSMKLACMTSMGLVAFAWISASAYLIYFFTLLAYCVIHSKPSFNIWNTSIVDHPWTPKPSAMSYGSAESIDSRRTLTDTHVHAFNFKAATSLDDSNLEKDMDAAALPIYSRNLAGPPTFGQNRTSGRREAVDLGTVNASARRGQSVGVNAINGAPAYYAQQQETYFNEQGPHRFHQNPRGDLEGQNRTLDRNPYRSAEPAQGSRQAPWVNSNDDETPSPAVITHAARVSQPSMSLYPAHVVATGLTTQSAKMKKPVKPDAAMNDLLRAAGLNQSVTSLPYMKSSVGHGRDLDVVSVRSGENGHSKSQSVDTFVQANPTEVGAGHRRSISEARGQQRGRRSGPRHKPPPLDLSSLSNIASADRRK